MFYDPQANGDPLKDEVDVIYGKNCEWTIDVKVLDGETAKLGITHAIKELNIVADHIIYTTPFSDKDEGTLGAVNPFVTGK